MSVNIYQNGTLTPIAGKTVPMPTPDYVDEQYNSITTYSKGMTCISGNKRYRYINSTASSGHQPPNATYWEELSVADELKVTCINNGNVEGISYVKHGKMRMLTIGSGANRTITDLTNFISQNITTDDLPKNTTGSTFQILTVSSGSWSMEIGQMIIYAKTSSQVSNQYALFKSGSLMPKTSTLLVGGQIVWFVE